MKFLAVFLTAGGHGVLLLSSLKEVSKKGATVSTRWTPTREQSPLDPAQREACSYRPTGFYPAHPAGRGYTPYRCGKRNLIGPTACKDKVSFTAATKNVSPGLQGKAGSSRWRDGLPSIDGGSPEGKTLWSSSTRSKGWRLSWFFFRRRKKNSPPADCRTSSTERRITLRQTAGQSPAESKNQTNAFLFLLSQAKEESSPAGSRQNQNAIRKFKK